MELELLAGLAEAGTKGWEGSRKDGSWGGWELSVAASPAAAFVCVHVCSHVSLYGF